MEAVELLGSIVKLAGNIRSRVQTVKANKLQCERLSVRIDTIVESLQGLKEKGLPSTVQFKSALSQLKDTLQECSEYIQKFSEKGKFKQFFKAKKYKNRFQEFNKQLGQAIADLNLGLNIHQVINPENDKQDKATDDAQLAEILDLQKEGLEEMKELKKVLADRDKEHKRQLASLKGHIFQLSPRAGRKEEKKKEEKEEKNPVTETPAIIFDDLASAEAHYQTGLAYQGKEEWEKAAESHQEATTRGHVKAGTTLGFFHLKGLGVKQDKTKAFTLFFQSAQQGHARAQYNLGAMYENGDGVPQDASEARKWYQQSADQGNEKAKKRLQRLN